MSRPIQVHIAGTPVRVGRLWLVVVLVLGAITASAFAPESTRASEAVAWYAATFVVALGCVASLFLHEFAHVWAARRVGATVHRVEPYTFGALSDDAFPPSSPRADATVAAAGPTVSLALGVALGVCWLIVRPPDDLFSLSIGFVALMNLVLGIANLLPVFPLDGGRILRAFVWHITGDLLSGARVVAFGGNFIALIGLITGAVLLSLGHPLSVWGAWTVLGFWAIHREGRDGYSRVVWREASRAMTIDDAGLANASRVDPGRTIDDAIDDVLQGILHGPMLVAGPDRVVLGVVSLAQIRRVPRVLWPERFIEDVAVPLEGMPRIDASAPILELLELFETTDAELVLIETRGRVTGVADQPTAHARVRARVREERLERRNRRN